MVHPRSKILWLKDMLEQLHKTHQHLQWASNPETVQVLTESMVRDLESCQRICEEINRRARVRPAI
jgi:hypothetical protein